MPELPEVETIVRDLRGVVVGQRVEGFASEWWRLTEPEPAALLGQRLAGATVTGVRRRGKLAVLDLDTGESLVISLRMSGQLVFRRHGEDGDGRHVRARIRFAGGDELVFSDQRKFGRMALVPSQAVSEALLVGRPAKGTPLHARLGPEPLSRSFTPARFATMLRARRRAQLKPLLLDQAFLAGVGNIYANEALFRARLHPLRRAGALRPADVAALHAALGATLRRAIRLRGSTIDDYRDGFGREGRMQREFLVHGRTGEPCPSCGRPIRKTYVGGRGTYWCATCQRAPRAATGKRIAVPRALSAMRRRRPAAIARPRGSTGSSRVAAP